MLILPALPAGQNLDFVFLSEEFTLSGRLGRFFDARLIDIID
jgi:hypothetical protein